ncbi:MAG: hypothetical protein PHN82_03905 [bacterium]|nr:hypothetical protein [bacterium]
MPGRPPTAPPIALFSVNDLREIAAYAGILVEKGWKVVATREAWDALRAAGAPAVSVSEFTGIAEEYPSPPPLHPRIEAALTAPAGAARIDLVYDIPYPLERGNDVGGMTLLALAVKGGRVAVAAREDMARVAALVEERGAVPGDERERLAEKALRLISGHYLALLRPSAQGRYEDIQGIEHARLAHGENPYQEPASLFAASPGDDDPLALHRFKRISGGTPCFTNMADLDSVVATLCLLAATFGKGGCCCPRIAVAAKHGNACGIALSRDDPLAAIDGALWGDPAAVWGGELVVNFALDGALAERLVRSPRREERCGNPSWMLDVVAAPAFSPDAARILGKRERRKLFRNAALAGPAMSAARWSYRWVRGGFLRQPPATYVLDLGGLECPSGPLPAESADDLLIAWATAYTSSHGGNEVALAAGGRLIGIGGGPSTVAAAETAVARARANGHGTAGAAFAADAFFPFTDAAALLADAGCACGLVPAGGRNEPRVRSFFAERGLRIGYIPAAYRGFCRH